MVQKNDPNNIGYASIETDTTNEDERIVVKGVLQEANTKNRNGRCYDIRDLFLKLVSTENMRGENVYPLSKHVWVSKYSGDCAEIKDVYTTVISRELFDELVSQLPDNKRPFKELPFK